MGVSWRDRWIDYDGWMGRWLDDDGWIDGQIVDG